MSVNWEELKISQAELDEIFELDILSTWAIDLSRVLILKKSEYLQSLLFTEGSILLISLIFFCPINLIIFRNFGWLENDFGGLTLVLLSASILSILLGILFNYYLWHKATKLKVLANLLAKIYQYNRLIDNLQLFAELNDLTTYNPDNTRKNLYNSQSEVELKTALSLTRNSLIKSIELEKIINQNQQLKGDRYLLLANLENNLINFVSLPHDSSNDEYQQLLTEVVDIGLSVHQEIRKIQTLKRSQ
jgi:hypothetical protein